MSKKDGRFKSGNQCPFERIGPALDRLAEAHFWIHGMEAHYHEADLFRWHLNVFLKAIQEVPDMVTVKMQNVKGFAEWYEDWRTKLKNDDLILTLREKRNFVVHRDMLLPKSRGTVGSLRGTVVKAGLTLPIHPLEDSDAAILRLAEMTKDRDFLGLTTPDEDTQPFVEREWRLQEFEEELVDLCSRAWLSVGQFVAEVLRWQGVEPPPLSLNCRHGGESVQKKRYDRNQLVKHVT